MTEPSQDIQAFCSDDQPGPGAVLTHPVIIAMLVLWIVNDHLLKDLLANALTGKLSDVASLAVFPLIPVTMYEIWCGLRGHEPKYMKPVLLLSLASTGSVMIGINVSAYWADAYRVGLGLCQWPFYAIAHFISGDTLPPTHTVHLTMDPTDIWTLPSLAIPAWLQLKISALRETGPQAPDDTV